MHVCLSVCWSVTKEQEYSTEVALCSLRPRNVQGYSNYIKPMQAAAFAPSSEWCHNM